MDGQPDGLALIGQGPLDRLLDPPGTVGGELAPLGGVEPLDSLDQADIPLGNEVEERQAEIGVIAGDLDDESQVGADHLGLGGLVPLLDLGGERHLLRGSQQGVLRDLAQVELESVI